jgi:hypothetical protein
MAFTSCSIEKRIYENGYHISWLHLKTIGPLADASQDLPQDLSENLSENLETDVSQDLSVNLSKNQEFKTPSDTITPTKKEDDYFGQKDYSKSNNKGDKPQNITELKKETKDNFKVALFGFVGWAVSLGLLSINDWSTLDSLKTAVFLIILGTACALLFLIFFPIGVFRLFKLAFLKLRGKPDEHKINQQSQKD